VPVAHQAPPAPLVDEAPVGGEERLDLGLHGLHQHPPGAFAQHRQERVRLDGGSWSRQRDDGILLHGVSSW
jgi:hypothetical protein